VRLAEAFGFCWGVERAVAMAYETRRHYPSERIWITNEIIHNPSVNAHLREMDVRFIPVEEGVKDFSEVGTGDVVILPAFGATVQEMQLLNERGCHIVDTTCPWVSKVWNTVEKHKKHAFTSIIHGKVKHEETLATSSFAGTYLVVLDLAEAQIVCDYILGQGDQSQAFMARFAKACSPGFDPDRRPGAGGGRQPDHHAQERNRGDRPDVRAHHAAALRTQPSSTSTSWPSTPSATPPRNGRTPCSPWWTNPMPSI
jgi:4-hydroxy-3-methylbut-2-enyl diphosphate reductase